MQYNTEHPVYPILQQIGQEITQRVKPKAVVVFSAHWMGDEDTVYINKEEHTDLVYEYAPLDYPLLKQWNVYSQTLSFYGFPDHFYRAQYPSKGSPELASKIMVMLSEAGIQTYGVKRGLDHGVWSGFSVGESSKHFCHLPGQVDQPTNCETSFRPADESSRCTPCTGLPLQVRIAA